MSTQRNFHYELPNKSMAGTLPRLNTGTVRLFFPIFPIFTYFSAILGYVKCCAVYFGPFWWCIVGSFGRKVGKFREIRWDKGEEDCGGRFKCF